MSLRGEAIAAAFRHWNECRGRLASIPLPLVGRGRGGGRVISRRFPTPHSCPPPQGGREGGNRFSVRRVVTASVAVAILSFAALAVVALSRAQLAAPKPTLIVNDRAGAFITQVSFAEDRSSAEFGYWPLERAPEHKRFADHVGVDPQAMARALWKNFRGRGQRSGASTIAMQIARMQNPAPRNLVNKTIEAATAIGQVGWRQPLGRLLETAAVSAQHTGNLPLAARLAGAADARFRTPRWYVPLDEAACLAAARALDPATWEREAAAGRRLTDGEVMALLRTCADRPTDGRPPR